MTMKRIPVTSVLTVAVALTALTVPALGQALPEPGWLATETAADYRVQARYPAHAHGLAADAVDPIIDKRTPNPITVAPRADEGPSLTVWPAEVAFVSPRPAIVFAQMTDAHGQALTGDLRGTVVDEAGFVHGKLAFFDDGVAPDADAGDGTYTAVHTPSVMGQRQRAESLMVRVSALPRGEQTAINAVTGFMISRPGAQLTGRFEDREADGNLVIRAQLVVKLAGRYHLKATIESADGSMIGITQAAHSLETGHHWIDLSFYGLMFAEAGIAGPYRIAAITLTDASTMPNALGAVIEKAHKTRAYSLARFTHRDFGDPVLLESARRLEADAARSRSDR